MADIVTLQQQLDALKAARSSGTREVQHKDSRIAYRTDEELVRAIATLEAEIAVAQGVTPVRNVVLRSPRERGW
jgi:hypothetical protein